MSEYEGLHQGLHLTEPRARKTHERQISKMPFKRIMIAEQPCQAAGRILNPWASLEDIQNQHEVFCEAEETLAFKEGLHESREINEDIM